MNPDKATEKAKRLDNRHERKLRNYVARGMGGAVAAKKANAREKNRVRKLKTAHKRTMNPTPHAKAAAERRDLARRKRILARRAVRMLKRDATARADEKAFNESLKQRLKRMMGR